MQLVLFGCSYSGLSGYGMRLEKPKDKIIAPIAFLFSSMSLSSSIFILGGVLFSIHFYLSVLSYTISNLSSSINYQSFLFISQFIICFIQHSSIGSYFSPVIIVINKELFYLFSLYSLLVFILFYFFFIFSFLCWSNSLYILTLLF